MGRHHCVPLRRRHDIPIGRREDIPLRRLGYVPLRPCWVFHLGRTCDAAGIYRETSLWRHHDVFLPGGKLIQNYQTNIRISYQQTKLQIHLGKS